jgi:uncharacterized membrane protein
MIQGVTVSFSPIGPWPLLVGASLVVLWLTLWAYSLRLKGTTGRWRIVALSLRLSALLLCLLAALRPSVVLKEKKREGASIVFLLDDSTSMLIADELRGRTRWDVAKRTLEEARKIANNLSRDLDTKEYRFDSSLTEPKDGDSKAVEPKAAGEPKGADEPKGRETAIGTAMLEAQKRQETTGRRTARMVIFSDFGSNHGINPLEVARRLKQQGVPVVTVGVGTENAGAAPRDVSLREVITNPTVFVKNQVEVRGNMMARGFANQKLDVELYVEGQDTPVAKSQVKVPESSEIVPITGLKFIPQTPGDKLLTLKVAKQDGELLVSNNEISTFVTVVSGGLNVLYIRGPNFSWDYRFLTRALEPSPDIQVEGVILRRPAEGDVSGIDDAEFAPMRYNVYILSDIAAEYFTPRQHKLLADAVKKGAGLIMLGGRSSFGPGGWGETELAEILPVEVHRGDDQNEPEGGIKFVPSTIGLSSYVLQVGANKPETARIWDSMHPIQGTNRFGQPKLNAQILASSPEPNSEPLLVSVDVGNKGRVLAYGGETWVWARATEEGRLAHLKFWRQVIFWLAHKENQSDNQIKLTLDRRRLNVGERLELTATARDGKGAAIPGVRYDCKVEREGSEPATVPIDMYTQGDEGRATRYANEQLAKPGVYRATVIANRDGQEIGRDTARFLVYQDDRELENPSADLKLAREIAELTGGDAVNPEKLSSYLKAVPRDVYTENVTLSEHKVWDNWPFLLIFTALLTMEWWIRKRHGWV